MVGKEVEGDEVVGREVEGDEVVGKEVGNEVDGECDGEADGGNERARAAFITSHFSFNSGTVALGFSSSQDRVVEINSPSSLL